MDNFVKINKQLFTNIIWDGKCKSNNDKKHLIINCNNNAISDVNV